MAPPFQSSKIGCNASSKFCDSNARYPAELVSLTNNTDTMPEDETLQHSHDESESEDEEEDVVEAIPKFDIDPTTLTPLSPEVISKQVRMSSQITGCDCLTFGPTGHD